MEQLHHETSESLECPRDADGWADSDEHVLGRLNVNLELAGLVDWRVEQGEQTLRSHVSWPAPSATRRTHLVCYIWPRLTNVAAHLPHDTNVIVAVEEVVLVLTRTRASARAMRRLICLEGGIAENDDQALGIFVVGGYGNMLLCYQPWQFWWRHRLGPCDWDSHISVDFMVCVETSTRVIKTQAADILARFFPRSGESRFDGLSLAEASFWRGPAIVESVLLGLEDRGNGQ